MRIFLTGSRGYIGAVMGPMLQADGHDVIGLDADYNGECTFGSWQEEVRTITKDLREITESDLKGFDAVVHLAALSNDPLGDLNEEITFEINHVASVRLAELSKRAGVRRFLFSSSCSNYGAAGEGLVNEESQLHPVTAYGVSKVRAESGYQCTCG